MGVETRIGITLEALKHSTQEGQDREEKRQWPKFGSGTAVSPVAVEALYIETHDEVEVGKRENEAAKLVAHPEI